MNANLKSVISMFEKMGSNGMPINNELKWGFYFLDRRRDNLKKVYDELRSHDYNLEAVEEMENGVYQLYVSKVEKLSPEKLHKRNVAFNELAEYCNVFSYDGWDVEKIIQ
ncbi:MAG: ribonuclease E inhibitor RraB [Chitinophagaceae bacterium]